MKSLSISSQVEREKWNRLAAKNRGCPFHSHEWTIYSSTSNQEAPLYFKWKNKKNAVTGIAFGLSQIKRLGPIKIKKNLYFGSLPALEDENTLDTALADILKYCREENIMSLSFNSFGTPKKVEYFNNINCSMSRRWEFLIDMNIKEEELWKKLHGKKRNLIRKGIKANLVVKKTDALEDILAYQQFANETYLRKKKKGIPYPGPGSHEYYKLMKEMLIDKNIGALYLAYNERQPVAGAFFVSSFQQVYYTLSSANQDGLRTAAPDLLIWSAMIDFQKRGYKIFNLGGLSESELNQQPLEKSGLYHFKKRFSADVKTGFKCDIVFKPSMKKVLDLCSKVKHSIKP
jgi:lipid II:glycine glycyltransferase (peptidoglycan interpeptide bridge formation enzyme)